MSEMIYNELQEIKKLISKKDYRKYLNIRQVIDYTSLSGSTIRRAINHGELIPAKRNGRLLFDIKEIERWLNG